MANEVTIVECTRDAWQGLRDVIPAEEKVQYLSRLIALGFRHIDAVSFVSPKYVPQMADSEAVMAQLSQVKAPGGEPVEIIGIVVNAQGLERALATPGVTTVGYPYSISAYFRRANANMSRAESRELVEKLQRDTKAAGRKLVIYISMAFGNPYEEPWGAEIVEETAERFGSAHGFAGGHGGDGIARGSCATLPGGEGMRGGSRDRRASA
jgi:hydroxymethylglutaryl-CoA lyase